MRGLRAPGDDQRGLEVAAGSGARARACACACARADGGGGGDRGCACACADDSLLSLDAWTRDCSGTSEAGSRSGGAGWGDGGDGGDGGCIWAHAATHPVDGANAATPGTHGVKELAV